VDGATYDVVVIGAGPVGENVADRVVQGGLTAAIVERELGLPGWSKWVFRFTAVTWVGRPLPARLSTLRRPIGHR